MKANLIRACLVAGALVVPCAALAGAPEGFKLQPGSSPFRVAPPGAGPNGSMTPLMGGGLSLGMAVRQDGALMTWGFNNSQLGNGALLPVIGLRPQAVPALSGLIIKQVAERMALTDAGDVYTWGSNSFGKLGLGLSTTAPVVSTPRKIIAFGARKVTYIAGNARGALAATDDGAVWAWGSNSFGLLGTGTNVPANGLAPVQVPIPVGSDSFIVQVAMDHQAVNGLALSSTGKIWIWGLNMAGQFGDGSINPSTTTRFAPRLVPSFLPPGRAVMKIAIYFTSSSAAGTTPLVLDSAGSVWAWGLNGSTGAVGVGTTVANYPRPQQILCGISPTNPGTPCTGIIDMSGGSSNDSMALALKDDGTVLAWGNNKVGGLGNGTNSGLGSDTPDSNSLSPILVLGSNGVDALSDVVAIALGSGARTAYAQKSDGTLVAWGANYLGTYGDGTYWGSNVPVPVSGLASLPDTVDPHDNQLKPAIAAVSKGQVHSMALMGDGTVMSWGSAGSNGNGTLANQFTPAHVLDVDGVGRLGAYPRSPIVAISGGGSNDETADLSLALDQSGQVFAWGGNALGGLSQPLTTTISLIPVRVNGLPRIKAIAAGHGFGLALADDGSGNVWAWGRGSNGQLGNGVIPLANWRFDEATSQIAPARVLSADRVTPLSGVTGIAVGQTNSFVIHGANRALLAFGANDQPQSNVPGGALGIGSVINQSLPVPVMDTDGVTPLVGVVAFSSSGENAYAVKADGTLLAWGENNFGNYGNGQFGFSTASTIPVKVSMPDTSSPVISVVAGGHFATALKADGSVYSWGHNNILGGGLNSNGSLGDGTFNDRFIPGVVFGLGSGSGVVSIAPATCNPIHVLALQRLPGVSTVLGWAPEYDTFNVVWGALGTGGVTYLPSAPIQQLVTDSPATSIALNPAAPSAAGWYNVPVTASASAVDAISIVRTKCAVDPVRVPTYFGNFTDGGCNTSVASNGIHAMYASTLDSNGSSDLVSRIIKIDTIPPTITVAGCPEGDVQLGARRSLTVTASDALSGLGTDPTGFYVLDTSTVGSKSWSVSAYDNAANSTKKSCNYTVIPKNRPIP